MLSTTTASDAIGTILVVFVEVSLPAPTGAPFGMVEVVEGFGIAKCNVSIFNGFGPPPNASLLL